ncbi:MFS transporter [Corynebacterium choanae]|uniref:Proline/betaine transporter n=1 Tax=Corynebacterium choanae TaxID=1862358 RepID=A0A3G6J6J3_9CORY|nr:MFS transporter [Corynebacterium choanae]AZA12538.1 Proline/betaine transporter [Corynebacterium choanae]
MATDQQARRRSMLIAASGTVIEWFDFSLFFYLATSLSHTFFPHGRYALLVTLATGAVGFLFRPLGAVVFGHIGDTKGRTTALIASAGLMAIAMAGIALMPGYESIGVWGGIGVLCLRALAGFSVGAEYTGIMVYLMESASQHRRGFAASWAAANSEVGALLAVGSAALTAAVLGTDGLHEWGWRLPFALGAVLAAGMIPLRRYMVETPVEKPDPQEATPLKHALTVQRRNVWICFFISTVGSASYFLTITYLPTYVETVRQGDSQLALGMGTIAAFAAILVTPLIGWLSDVWGRRRTFGATLAVLVLIVLPGYALLGSPSIGVVTAAVAVLALPAAAWSAVAAAAVPEQFDAHGRYSGMAVGYNVATVLFGGLTPAIVAQLTEVTGDALTPAYYAGVIALLAGVPAVWMMREGTTLTKRQLNTHS